MLSDNNISINISPLKKKEKDDKDNGDKYVPPKEFKTVFKGTYNQPLKRMWRIIYDDGRLPIEERETFLEEYTLKGKTDFDCSDWESPDKSHHTDCYHPDPIQKGWIRNINYIMDIDSPIGPKHTRTSADEEILIFEPTQIVIESTSSTPDVPYGTSFNTIIIQYLYEDEITHETNFEIYSFIRWTKSCIIKKSIEKYAFNGMVKHQKEMDQALKQYIEENPDPKYVEDSIHFSNSLYYNNEPYYSFDYDDDNQHLLDLSIPMDDSIIENRESHAKLLQDLSQNKYMTTLNNNLVYDNILEIKEKELEKNQYGKNTYCSSLANTFNSSYVNYSERSVFEEKIIKLKNKSYRPPSNGSIKWILATILMVIALYVLYSIQSNFKRTKKDFCFRGRS